MNRKNVVLGDISGFWFGEEGIKDDIFNSNKQISMKKEEKAKVNQAIIDLKAKKTALKKSRGQGQIGEFIEKASGILEKLELWRSVVQEEEFIKTLQSIKRSNESTKISELSASMLEAFLAKDFKSTQDFYEEITKIKVELKKPEYDVLREINQTLASIILGNVTWQSFSVLLSSTVSIIIKAIFDKESDAVGSGSDTEAVKHFDPMGPSDIGWLFTWIRLVGQSVLILTVNQNTTDYRWIRCKYHVESYVDLLLVGDHYKLSSLTYSDLRKKLRGKMKHEFAFVKWHSLVYYETSNLETTIENNAKYETIFLAMFLPLISSDGSFDIALNNLLEDRTGVLQNILTLGEVSTTYISASNFGDNIIRQEISKMILANNKDIAENEDIDSLVEKFNSLNLVEPVEYSTPYGYDPKECKSLTSMDIFSELTGTDVSKSFNHQDILIITGLHRTLNMKDILGEVWSHDQSTYKLSYIDDSMVVYEKQAKANND